MTKEQEDAIYEIIHNTAIHVKDKLITRREAERKIAELLKKLEEMK